MPRKTWSCNALRRRISTMEKRLDIASAREAADVKQLAVEADFNSPGVAVKI